MQSGFRKNKIENRKKLCVFAIINFKSTCRLNQS